MIDPFDFFPGSAGRGNEAGAAGDGTSLDALSREVRRLERRTDQVAVVCQALWELLRENTNLSDRDLLRRIHEVDLRDGIADGRMTPVPAECPSCQRTSTSKRGECLYCGNPLPGRNLLEHL